MKSVVRLGSGSGFWGDTLRPEALARTEKARHARRQTPHGSGQASRGRTSRKGGPPCTQREPTSFTPEGTLKRQRRLMLRSTARNSIVAAGI